MSSGPIENVIGNYMEFLERVFAHLEDLKIDVSAYELDHLCYRVESLVRYEVQKAALLKWGKVLTEADVNGRPIATFQLDIPLRFRERTISVIELPAPKHGKTVIEGLEHIEFAVGEEFTELPSLYPALTWNKAGAQKKLNPELEIALAPNLAVKFHPLPLSKVIEIELQETFRMQD